VRNGWPRRRVRYLRAEAGAVAESAERPPDENALAEALRALPGELLARLEQAAVRAEMGEIDRLIEEVAGHNRPAATRLRALADDFEYARIAALAAAATSAPTPKSP